MQRALELWLSAYGCAAGDLALQELCTGGLWIGGGTAAKQLAGLQSAHFLDAMRAKGRFKTFINDLEIKAVIDPQAGLFSAACRARRRKADGTVEKSWTLEPKLMCPRMAKQLKTSGVNTGARVL